MSILKFYNDNLIILNNKYIKIIKSNRFLIIKFKIV